MLGVIPHLRRRLDQIMIEHLQAESATLQEQLWGTLLTMAQYRESRVIYLSVPVDALHSTCLSAEFVRKVASTHVGPSLTREPVGVCHPLPLTSWGANAAKRLDRYQETSMRAIVRSERSHH